jgi:hypothetical protein
MFPGPLLSSQATSVKAPPHDGALYNAIPPSVNVPVLVSRFTDPPAGATKLNHTSAPENAAQPGAGGPAVLVDATLLPLVLVHVVLTVSATAPQGSSLTSGVETQMSKVPDAPPLPQTRT